MKWISKAPGKKVSVTNLLQMFDLTSWLLIIASLVVMSVMLITVQKIQHQLGGEDQDIFLSIITPIAMLTAENISSTVRNSRPNQLFTRNFLLRMWSVMGTIIVFLFVCNLRAMLLKPARDTPIDTTKELLLQEKIPIVVKTQDKQFLEASPNVWQREAGQNALMVGDPNNMTTFIEKLIQTDGTHVIEMPVVGLWRLRHQKKQIPLHFSEENLYSYYLPWVMAKKSPWKNMINNHLQLYMQVRLFLNQSIQFIKTEACENWILQAGLHQRQERRVLRHLKPVSKEDLEKIKLGHIILPLSLLAIGWIVSTIQFLIEKIC